MTSEEFHPNARVIIKLNCISDCNADLTGLNNAFIKTFTDRDETWIYHDTDIPKGTSVFKYTYISKEEKNPGVSFLFRENIAKCYSDPVTDVTYDPTIFG